jgi:hypothetical protein
LLLALTLVVPIIIAANPIDSQWLTGWYDESDADQLIINAMSAGSLLSPLTLSSLLLSGAVMTWSVSRRGRYTYSSVVARGPPSAPSPKRALAPRRRDYPRSSFLRDIHYPETYDPDLFLDWVARSSAPTWPGRFAAHT